MQRLVFAFRFDDSTQRGKELIHIKCEREMKQKGEEIFAADPDLYPFHFLTWCVFRDPPLGGIELHFSHCLFHYPFCNLLLPSPFPAPFQTYLKRKLSVVTFITKMGELFDWCIIHQSSNPESSSIKPAWITPCWIFSHVIINSTEWLNDATQIPHKTIQQSSMSKKRRTFKITLQGKLQLLFSSRILYHFHSLRHSEKNWDWPQ